jgi:glucose/arabinose dehydrogenase
VLLIGFHSGVLMMLLRNAVLISAFMLTGASAVAADAEKIGKDAFGSWQEDKPGIVRLIGPKDLAQPVENETSNFADVITMPAGAKPKLSDGFSAEMVAKDIKSPRALRIAPNGDLFVADSKANQIRVYRLQDGSSQVEQEGVFATSLHQPYGMAFYPADNPQWIYVGNSNSVVRFPYKSGDLKATGEAEMIVDHIPSAHHWTRDLAFSPDGSRLYVAIGSGSNVALDMSPAPFAEGGLEGWKKDKPLGAAWDTEEGRADVIAYDPDGKNAKIYATGLRNCSGLTVRPGTSELWCAVNERDGLGDNVPFDYATAVKEGAFYGWPWYYIGNHEDPRHKGERPDLATQVTVPEVLFQGHSAPLGITFYSGSAFPAEYQGNAFVALHGSWNRTGRTGYKVVMLKFKDGKPTGEYQDFMTGFVVSDKQVWGRPVGVAVAKDGALLVSEDGSGTIWRVTYKPVQSTGVIK